MMVEPGASSQEKSMQWGFDFLISPNMAEGSNIV